MSPVAKAAIERKLMAQRARRRAAIRPGKWFRRDPDRASGALWHADDPVTPAARLLVDGEPFTVDDDGRYYCVEDVHPSTLGPQTDVLIVRGHDHETCGDHPRLLAIQVRDLETLIDEDRVEIPFLGSARQFNIARGWTRGGRTLASLGITLGSANPFGK